MVVIILKGKFFTGLSFFCFMLNFLIIGFDFFDFLYDKGIFTPLIIGVLGIISAFLGIKGNIRMILILFNSFLSIVFLYALLIGIFGFQQP